MHGFLFLPLNTCEANMYPNDSMSSYTTQELDRIIVLFVEHKSCENRELVKCNKVSRNVVNARSMLVGSE